MRPFTQSVSVSSRTLQMCTGKFSLAHQIPLICSPFLPRFRDIGYNHIPYYNCPNSPKCSGCTPGQFYSGADFLAKEDCRPTYFKYVGTH